MDQNTCVLLVAPSYDHISPRLHLPGTKNDIATMKGILTGSPFSVDEGNMETLEGLQATKNSILQKLSSTALRVPHGGVFIFYYSGHGIEVTNNAERIDEGIVPADVTLEQLRNGDGSVCITGEDFRPILAELTAKAVCVAFVFDCCHSGHVYRDVTWNEAKYTISNVKQVFWSGRLRDGALTKQPPTMSSRACSRHGWQRQNDERFVHIAACDSIEVALEVKDVTGKPHGLLTLCIKNVLEKLAPDQISRLTWNTFHSLVERELELCHMMYQTPQMEGDGSLLLFKNQLGVKSKVDYKISSVSSDGSSVNIMAGQLQLFKPGVYDVYDATIADMGPDLILQGPESSLWRCRIDINESGIDMTTSVGHVTQGKAQNGMIGCVCRMVDSVSIRWDVLLETSDDPHAKELEERLDIEKMFNVSRVSVLPESLDCNTVVISQQSVNGEAAWLVKRNGKVCIPPIRIEESHSAALIAINLAKAMRYNMALAQHPALSSYSLLVKLSIHKLKACDDFSVRNTTFGDRIREGLATPELMPSDDIPVINGTRRMPNGKILPRSGDALVWQVKNNESFKVHICVLLFSLDGSVICIYPSKEGRTVDLGPGETHEHIFRTCIPEDAIRKFTCPDPSSLEPREGQDILVLYATNAPSDFSPLLQKAISLEYNAEKDGAPFRDSPLDKFKIAMKARNLLDEDMAQSSEKWLVDRRPFMVRLPSN